ncbi:chromate transporter [Beduinella massiliensis]|uniref:chromate transporter n=1 Tax=Beduinella massiliensis TaxID=1852363 RepID=UPI000C84B855
MGELLSLFRTFFSIGALTFGGGYAMLPMLQREVVEKHGWATEEELLNYFAIGQCTPGIIAVNTATFVGYRRRGVPGGIAATAGVVAPSLVIITLIALLLENFMDIAWVQHAFAGVRVAVSALIVASVVKMGKNSVRNAPQAALALAAFVLVAVLGTSPVWVVLGCVLLSLILGRSGVSL